MPHSPPPPNAAASPVRRSHWLAWTVIAGVVLAVAALVYWRVHSLGAAGNRMAGDARPIPVTAEPARTTDLGVRLVALGTVTPVSTVTVRTRVDGQLQKVYFTEGQVVEAGAPLADVDPRPFAVQKQQAEAQLARDQAQLANARLDLERFRTLLAQDSVAKQQVDTQEALVQQAEATVKLDQAQIDNAALQLEYAHITAPIAGRVGLRLVDAGNMIHTSDAGGLAVITQLRPITVLFSIPQDALPKVLARFKSGEEMAVEAFDRDGHTRLATGRLVTVDNQIDPTTGTVKLRAEFPNTDETLFPNQFVNVQLVAEQIRGATVVANAAVQRGTVGTFVYVVNGGKTANVRKIETGPVEHGQTVVTSGLHAGEVVVVDGVDRLRDGSAVELIDPAAAGAAPAAGTAGKHWSQGGGNPKGNWPKPGTDHAKGGDQPKN